LPIEETRERICAEILCPYPPGIAILMPGKSLRQMRSPTYNRF